MTRYLLQSAEAVAPVKVGPLALQYVVIGAVFGVAIIFVALMAIRGRKNGGDKL